MGDLIKYTVKGPPSGISSKHSVTVMQRANMRAARTMGESFGKAVAKQANKLIKEQRTAEAKAAAKEEPAPRITYLTELPGPVTQWKQGEYTAVGVMPKGIKDFEKLSPENLAKAIEELGGKPRIWSLRPASRELERIILVEYRFNRKINKVYRNAVYRIFKEQLRRVNPVFVPGKPKGLIRRVIEKLKGV